MKTATTRFFVIFCAACLVLSTAGFCADGEPAGSYRVVAGYEPGMGEPLGKVLMVMGDGVILHLNETAGYNAEKGLPLYRGDTLLTLEKSRLRLSLNDGSIMTLAPQTTLTINRSVYDPENKTRSTFLGLDTGKARFWAVKMKDFKNSEFNVKTKTAVAGVRGSDFVVEGSDDLTEVTALKDTLLALTSLFNPEADPMMLSDFERSKIPKDALPTQAERIGMDEIEEMMREFLFEGERFDPDTMIETTGEQEEEKAASEETGAADAGNARNADDIYKEFSEKNGILIPTEALIRPDTVSTRIISTGIKLEDVVKKNEVARVENDTKAEATSTREQIKDDGARQEPPEPHEYPPLPGPVDTP